MAFAVSGRIIEGYSPSEAANIGGMERQTLCDGGHRFSAGGVDGLKDCHAEGLYANRKIER